MSGVKTVRPTSIESFIKMWLVLNQNREILRKISIYEIYLQSTHMFHNGKHNVNHQQQKWRTKRWFYVRKWQRINQKHQDLCLEKKMAKVIWLYTRMMLWIQLLVVKSLRVTLCEQPPRREGNSQGFYFKEEYCIPVCYCILYIHNDDI